MELIFTILTVWSITTIIVYSKLLSNIRAWIIVKNSFFGSLITCVQCTSVWVGFIYSLLLFEISTDIIGNIYIINNIVDAFFLSGTTVIIEMLFNRINRK